MDVKTIGTCRGDGKIYTKILIDGVPDDHHLKIEVYTKDNERLPASLYKSLNQNPCDSQKSFVITLPILNNLKQFYTLYELNEDNEPVNVYKNSISMFTAKWESRFNYKFNKKLCTDIRDFDEIGTYEQINIEFWECISDGEENILRGLLRIPYEVDSDITIKCYTGSLQPIVIQPIFLSDVKTKSNISEEVYFREIQFSLRLPQKKDNYLLIAQDKKHPQYDNFSVLDEEQYDSSVQSGREQRLNAQIDSCYDDWFFKHKADLGMLAKQQKTRFETRPLFSIIVPLYKTPLSFFDEMLASVQTQSYGRWELILVNASKEESILKSRIEEAKKSDKRIKVITLEKNLGITENTNAGIVTATGDFVSFFDHDDILEPNLLFEYTKAINEHPDTDLLYCDEDKLMPNGSYSQPFLKPCFSIDLLRNNNYICHLLTVRKTILDSLEPATSEFDGAQDHNLTLRVAEKARHIHHVSEVLYHWRISENSTAANADSKPYATQAGIRAVQEHLNRLHIPAHVTPSRRPFTYKVDYLVPEPQPLVSIIIPTKDNVDVLDTCLRSLLNKTTYTNFEVILVENNSTEPKTFKYYESLPELFAQSVRVIRWEQEFNFSKLINFGVKNAQGDYLIFLNNDTELITPNWVETMLGICLREEVGAVGVRLYYRDNLIQHAGVCVTGSAAGHLNLGLPSDQLGYFALSDATQNLSAVTAACMMTKRSVFTEVGGFSEELAVAFNDVDYCLKVRDRNYLVVYTPEVELFHYESLSRGSEDSKKKKLRFHKEVAFMNYRWASYYVSGDPYINQNFDTREPFNCYYKLSQK